MYRVHVRTHLKNGAMPEGMAVAREITDYVSRKYDISVQTYAQPYGEAGVIHWMADYPDLAAVEKVETETLGDRDYWALVKKIGNLTIDGSTTFVLLRAI